MKKKVLVLPGDGVGLEVCDAALMVLEQFQLPIEFTYGDIGWECWKQEGDSVPQATWQKITESDAVLLGAVTSKGKEAALKELAPYLREKGLSLCFSRTSTSPKVRFVCEYTPYQIHFRSEKAFSVLCYQRE